MKSSILSFNKWNLWLVCLATAFCVSTVRAQSASIEFPTPITSSEIRGTIRARDIGDSRTTTHYYTFNGNQGDIFLKIGTANLNGDIDVFYAENLRPITKISVYADSSSPNTSREIYLRKPEKLILKIEGRTPIDDAATYSIKFEGSFQALRSDNQSEQPETPTVKSELNGVKVNSVGTIIETKSETEPETAVAKEEKPEATPKASANTTRRTTRPATTTPKPATNTTARRPARTTSPKTTAAKKPEVEVTESAPEKTETAKETETASTEKAKPAPSRKTVSSSSKTPAKKAESPKLTPVPTKAQEIAAALENLRLVIVLKDGSEIAKPMSEVLRVNVDKGILTVIAKDGAIKRFSVLDITKMTIE